MGRSKDIATSAKGDADYVNVSGDTMTGNLLLGSNKIGIGTSSPAKPLSVVKAGGGDFIAEFQNTTSGTPYGVHVKDASSGSNGYPLLQVTNSAGNSTYFRVDSGTGIVTMPVQPAFRAYLSTEWTTTGAYVSSGWTENYDRNGDFNQGTFTAPVAGVYHFTVNWDANASQSTLHMYHNGNYTYRREPTGRTDDNWESYGYSVDVKMAANDYVKLYLQAGSGNNPIHMGGGYWGFFAGHLVS